MCHFKSWYLDGNGYVVKCENCRHFQVCFGTTMLTLSEEDYEVFALIVNRKKEDHVHMDDVNVRCVVLPTPSSAVNLLVTENELFMLYRMLQEADNEMKAQQLIDLFAGNAE